MESCKQRQTGNYLHRQRFRFGFGNDGQRFRNSVKFPLVFRSANEEKPKTNIKINETRLKSINPNDPAEKLKFPNFRYRDESRGGTRDVTRMLQLFRFSQ
jgi:hypothetical protein